MLGSGYQRRDCSLARALEVAGERWTLLIIRHACYGVRRFNDFQAHPDIPKAVPSERLSGLAGEGARERRPDPHRGGRHVYELTAAGRDLWPVLHSLLVWGDRHRYPNSRPFRHATCGTGPGGSGDCATCEVTPGPHEIAMEPRPGRGQLRNDRVPAALRAPRRLLEPVETGGGSPP